MSSPTSTHLFCGGGGDVAGFVEAGFAPDTAVNHNEDAVRTIAANFLNTRALQADINNLDMRSLPETDALVGSPICKEVSPAGGNARPKKKQPLPFDGAPKDVPPAEWKRTRATATDLIRAAEVHRYKVVCGENVPEFASWELFDWWFSGFTALGYTGQLACANAAHLSGPNNPAAPQSRDRMLFCFTRNDIEAPDLRVRPDAMCTKCGPVQGIQQWNHGIRRKVGAYGEQYRYVCPNRACGHLRVEPATTSIRDCIDVTLPGTRIGGGKRGNPNNPYVEATRAKVQIGLDRFGGEPFLVVMRRNCTVQSLDGSISTITAEGNHHSLIIPGATVDDSTTRVLAPAEKAGAQRFRVPKYQITGGITAQNLQIGNAVPVNAAHWLAARVLPVLT